MSKVLPYQIKTTRDNLLFVGRMSIKSVIDRSCFETLHDRAPEVINFCNILEHLLSFCTKAFSYSFFAVDNKRHPWVFIRDSCRSMPDSCVQTIDTMENLKGYYAKLRGFIKLALLQKRLAEYLTHAVQQEATLVRFYDPRSLMRSPELNVYINTLMGLTAVDFSFDLRGEDQTHPGLMCIDYTPYLRFTPSDESLLDDALECDEHLDLSSNCPWQERFIKLEVKYKQEAKQKHFLEERLRALDALMMSREVEREQFETEMKQLESVILELQIQITLLQEQYREELVRLGGNPDTVPNVPAARGITRPLPPSLMKHQLAAVEPTTRPLPGLQTFASGRRYSSPQTSSRENLSRTSQGMRDEVYEALEDRWGDDDYERRKQTVPVILFPEDEQETSPEPESRETSGLHSSLTDHHNSISPAVTPDVVRRLRDGGSEGTSGYYRLMETPRDTESASTSLLENARRDFIKMKLPQLGLDDTSDQLGDHSAEAQCSEEADVREANVQDDQELNDEERKDASVSSDVLPANVEVNDVIAASPPTNDSGEIPSSSGDVLQADGKVDDVTATPTPGDDVKLEAAKTELGGSNGDEHIPESINCVMNNGSAIPVHLSDANDNNIVDEGEPALANDVNDNRELPQVQSVTLQDSNDNCEVTVVKSVTENGEASIENSSGL